MNEFYKTALDQISKAIEDKVSKKYWHQTISGRGQRATLSQQFTLDLHKYTMGWRQGAFLIGKNDHDEEFTFTPGNEQKALNEAINYIKYRL